MQLRPLVLASILCGLVAPAQAGICTLTLGPGGTLALSADGTRLGSGELGGNAGSLTVTSIGSSTVTVSAPTHSVYPPGHAAGSDVLEVAYFGAGLLAAVNQGYTSSGTSFGVPNIISAVTLTFNNRITNSAGFAAGLHQTRTVVTCS